MTGRISLPALQEMKGKQLFCCLTSYDASFARLLAEEKVELQLVGDSLGMVIQGHDSTLPVTVQDIAYHVRCVQRGNNYSFLLADMPFAAHADIAGTVAAAAELMRAGAQAVKLEGGAWLVDTVRRLRDCGIPTCGHLGLAPQSIHLLGGYRRQATDQASADCLLDDAGKLQDAGAVLMLLENVPEDLAARVTQSLDIPVIGIGAGAKLDGQVLVLYDILGLSPKAPPFAPDLLLGNTAGIRGAVQKYCQAVRAGKFPPSSR